MYEFDGDRRKYDALMDYVAFRELNEFVGNNAALQTHANSYEIVGDVEGFSPIQIEQLRVGRINTLKETLSHFGSQTIVSLCTTFEVSAREYLRALFIIKPQSMFEFLGAEDSRGHVPLKEILQAASHNELIGRLAHTAAGTASKGKYGQVFLRALTCSGFSCDKDLIEKLNALQVERNKLVHERHRPNVGMEEVLQAHLVVDEAIESFCRSGVDAGVHGRFTCVNPEMRLIVKNIAINARHPD